jgi:hypothetical protein
MSEMSNDSSLEQGETPEEKELERLKQEKEAATLRKEIAEAQEAEAKAKKAKLEAEIPAGKSQPVEGKITADEKSGYVATLAAYTAMIAEAGNIADEVAKQNLGASPHLLIVDSLDFCALDVQLIQILSQLSFWEGELAAQIKGIQFFIEMISPPSERKEERGRVKAAFAGAPAFAGGIVSSIADIVGYFRVDYDIKGQAISLSNTTLQALVARHIIGKNKCSVYLPAFHRFDLPSLEKITVIVKLNECIKRKDELKTKIYELKGQLLSESVENKIKNGALKAKDIIGTEEACKKAEDVIKEFAEFNKAVTSVPQGGGYSPIVSAAIRQYLDDIVKITHLLYLNVTSAGGEMVIGKGLFQWGKVGFLGGCVVTYVLADCSGQIVAANTFIGYSKVKYKLCRNTLTDFEAYDIGPGAFKQKGR